VNLLTPSQVLWTARGSKVRVTQQSDYPGSEEGVVSVEADRPAEFTLHFRVPSWCKSAEISVNGETKSGSSDQWLSLHRTWQNDKVTLRLPMRPRAVPVDPQHPNRIAVKYGPLLMVQDARYTFPIRGNQATIVPNLAKVSNLPELRFGMVGTSNYNPGAILGNINMANGEQVGRFIPLWSVPERNPYRTYIDTDRKTFF
jgi:DUF1680 family protein